MSERPSPYELWRQANGDRDECRRLLREHGHLIDRQPVDDPNLPCGWPGKPREAIYDGNGELAASFCPTDTPLSAEGRAALEALVRAVRKDMATGGMVAEPSPTGQYGCVIEPPVSLSDSVKEAGQQ